MPLRVLLPGGSGFLGSALAPALRAADYQPIILSRTPATHASDVVAWDGRTITPQLLDLVNDAHAVVNFVGRSVDCRKTTKHKKEILDSRIDSVRALAGACAQVPRPPKVWIQTSTAHIYGDTADEFLDESSPTGAGFAPDVGRAWEQTFTDATANLGIRKVILRISFVLGRDRGALATLARLARCFLGGTIATGTQYMSWIHIADLNRIILRALASDMHGTYVATAPHPVPNHRFMRELRRAVGRPWSPAVPAPLVRLGSLLLRTDPELALYGRRCVPTRLLAEGFKFNYPALREALQDLFSH